MLPFFNNYGAIKRGSISVKWPEVRGWEGDLHRENKPQLEDRAECRLCNVYYSNVPDRDTISK